NALGVGVTSAPSARRCPRSARNSKVPKRTLTIDPPEFPRFSPSTPPTSQAVGPHHRDTSDVDANAGRAMAGWIFLALWTSTNSIAVQPTTFKHVRSAEARIRERVADGYTRSATFKTIVDAVEKLSC